MAMAGNGMVWTALVLALAVTEGAASVSARTLASVESWKLCADGDPDRSIEGCSAVIEARDGGGISLASAFATRATARLAKGQIDLALRDLDEAIRLNPSFVLALEARGRIYMKYRRYDRAIRDYDEAIRLNPSFADAFYNRGLAYTRLGQRDRAIRDYDEAIRLRPSYADAYYSRGITYRNKGEHERAIQEFDHVLRLEPGADDARQARCESFKALGRTSPAC
jgi:tetratricopeptide (TPR) repeat protein